MLILTVWALAIAYAGTVLATKTLPCPSTTDSSCAESLKSLGLPPSAWSSKTICSGNARQTCRILQHLFSSNETFTGVSHYYESPVEVPYSEVCWKDPACFVTPNTSEDVSMVMRVLTATKTKFAIRSAGNLDIPGFNAVGSDGVVIALQNLNKKVLSADKRYGTIGTGLTWKSIYSWVEPYGVQIVGGREPRVGAGGFLLSGHDVYLTLPNVDQYPAAQKAISFWSSTVTKIAKDGGVFLPFIYSNNGNANSKILSGYGEDNFNFIRETAKKHDPHGVMQTLQNDGFLIRKEE